MSEVKILEQSEVGRKTRWRVVHEGKFVNIDELFDDEADAEAYADGLRAGASFFVHVFMQNRHAIFGKGFDDLVDRAKEAAVKNHAPR